MFKKTYLSRAMSRAYSMDAPVGDPFGGPAFGERNDPVSATVAFFEAATAFEVIAAVGTALSVVGMVTGNGDLTKIGGVMGLVGGFGTMAQSGMFGGGMQEWAQGVNQSFGTSTASNISSAASAVDPGATMVDGMSASQVVDMQGGAAQAGLIEGGVDLNLAQAVTPGVDGVVTGPVSEPTMIAADGTAAGAQNIASTPVPSVASNPALNVGDAATMVDGATAEQVAGMAKAGAAQTAVKAAGGGIDTGTSLFDRISQFANKNKALTEMALKGVASAYQSPQAKAALDAQAASANAASGLYGAKTAEIQGQMANANAIPTVTGMRVDPNAQIYNAKAPVAAGVRPAGLIQTRSV